VVSRKVVFSLISVMLMAAAALAASRFLHDDREAQATLFPQKGDVTVRQRSGTHSSPARVMKVGEGDSIQTGAESRALLAFSAEVTSELGPSTEVLVSRLILAENDPPTIELKILQGDTWHEQPSSLGPEARYKVVTPSAEATLIVGRHRVTVDSDGATRVEVSEGVARVRALGSEVEVRAGEYTSIALGRAPSVPRPMVARLLLVSEREGSADIWLRDEDGQESKLTGGQADDLSPAWSPDGARIAFESTRDGNSEIYVMNADGSNQVNVSNHPAYDGAPAWSPDGTMIAFESLRDGQEEIYLMNADGSEQDRLTTGPGLKLAPSWLENGLEIVFSNIETDSNADGMIDSRDMAAFFCLDPRSGTVQSFWGGKTVLDQMTFPWGRRRVG
jgi:hypothetical protein